jgi:nucleoside-diphosphate-sugar epimerase
MKKILILGSNGYIGSHLISRLLQDKKIYIIAYDLNHTEIYDYKNIEYINDDIFNLQNYYDKLKDIDYVVDFIGSLGGLNSFEDYEKNISLNNLATLKILDFIKNVNNKIKIIFISSRLVYSRNAKNPITENAKKEPLTIYGVNKLASENYIKAYSNLYNIDYINLRLSIPYGADDIKNKNYGIVNSFIRNVLNNEDIYLFGDGQQKRDIISIFDVVWIIGKIIKNFDEVKNDTYNLGGNEIYSLKEIGKIIIDIFQKGTIKYKEWPEKLKKIETFDSYLSTEKLKLKLDFKYKHEFKKYIKDIAENDI